MARVGGYGDNFSYSGTRVTPLTGEVRVLLNAQRNTGTMIVTVHGTINPEKGKRYTGEIKIVYTIAKKGPAFWESGVADFIYLHGNTKQGPPVMPKLRAFLAAWGSADVYVDGKVVYRGLDGHMMYTERTRDPKTKAIYNRNRTGFYSPKNPTNASIAVPEEKELHFVVHSTVADKGNFPPHSVWIHPNFQDVADLSYSGR